MKKTLIVNLLACLLLAGCASNKNVMFVTKTSLSLVDADTKPVGVSIAYDRIEGVKGPVYANGAIPPVYSSILTDTGVFTPQIKQLYATGNAALIAAGSDEAIKKEKLISSSTETMFFGTSTTTGIKIGATNMIPDSFLFGYRRKESSYIPLGQKEVEDGNGKKVKVDVYPSVLASIDTTSKIKIDAANTKEDSPKFKVAQLFATGGAAQRVAKGLRSEFSQRTAEVTGQGQIHVAAVASCYIGLSKKGKLRAWHDAAKKKLFHDKENYSTLDTLKAKLKSANEESDSEKAGKLMGKADAIYLRGIFIKSGEGDIARDVKLGEHRQNVCFLSEIENKESKEALGE